VSEPDEMPSGAADQYGHRPQPFRRKAALHLAVAPRAVGGLPARVLRHTPAGGRRRRDRAAALAVPQAIAYAQTAGLAVITVVGMLTTGLLGSHARALADLVTELRDEGIRFVLARSRATFEAQQHRARGPPPGAGPPPHSARRRGSSHRS
jgi:hypothetical protein